MKRFIFTLLISLPILIYAQRPQQFYEKGNQWFVQVNNPGTLLSDVKNQIHENFRFPAVRNAFPTFPKANLLFNENQKIHQNSETRQEPWKLIFKSASQDTMRLDSIYRYKFLSLTDSLLIEKILYSYDESENHYTITTSARDSITQKWSLATKEDFFCDQNGKDTVIILYMPNAGEDWVPVHKRLTTYSPDNQVSSQTFYNWNNLIKQWHGEYKVVYEFDDNGNNTLTAQYTWHEGRGTWQGSSKSEYSYNDRGLQEVYIFFIWDYKLFDWVATEKIEFTYNEEDIQIAQASAQWDTVSKTWNYIYKVESETAEYEGGYSYYYAYYMWDNLSDRWKGMQKAEYFISESVEEIYAIGYTWNDLEARWEAAYKVLQEVFEQEMKMRITNYEAKDSIVIGELITGFDNKEEFSNIWITSSCPDQTCTAVDSDRVEGNASILWDYHINGNYYPTGGFCQVQVNTDKDLSPYSGLLMNFKVLIPSVASFTLRITETSGEVWMYEDLSLLADSSGQWQQIVFPFSEMFGTGNYIDGVFDYQNIKNVQLRLFVPNGIKTSGAVLIDNLSVCRITKTDQWMIESFEEEFYDEHGNIILEISKIWDKGSQQFVEDYKYKIEYAYNPSGQVTSSVSYFWQEPMEDWSNNRKEMNKYDENGNMINSESYSWNPELNKWVGDSKTDQSFSETGNVLISIYYQWDTMTDSWSYAGKTENTYTLDGILNSTAYYNWDVTFRKWIGQGKEETVYNPFGEIVKTLYYVWNPADNEWIVSDIYLVTYDEILYTPEGLIALQIYMTWDETTNDWSPVEKTYFFWSSHTITDSPEALANNNIIEIYPNPATDVIYIKLNSEHCYGTFKLYDNRGLLMKEAGITGTYTSVTVSNLPSGLYILHVETDGKNNARKIIIR